MSSKMYASRRNFLKTAGLAGAASITHPSAHGAVDKSEKHAKNLIFLVADGMGTGTLSLAEAWKRCEKGEETEWLKMYREQAITRSLQDTASANSPVTDSAAAASAWGGGQRVNNGAINVLPSGEKPEPIFLSAKEAGKATGVVSTCRITHATPAGFIANIESRNSEDAIADQYLDRELDLYLGGGTKHFSRENEDLLSEFKKKGYSIATNKKTLSAAESSSKVLGLFSDDHVPYAIDRMNDPKLQSVPSLEEMFETSLKVLSKKDAGFVLQVEAGRVDHAGHENDPATILHEQLEFDRCIKVALDFVKENPDTLLVVTTDHGTGGCQLNGVGSKYRDTKDAVRNLSKITGSIESLHPYFKSTGKFDTKGFEENTGISVTDEKAEEVIEKVAEFDGWFGAAVGAVFAEELQDLTGVGWTSHNHTGEHVELAAMGPGSEAFPAFINNDEVYSILRSVLKI